jgi:hypothetical protein
MFIFCPPYGKIRNVYESEAMVGLEPYQVRFIFRPLQHNGREMRWSVRPSNRSRSEADDAD